MVRQGKLRGALLTLLDGLAEDPLHLPSLEAAARMCGLLGAPEEGTLFEDVFKEPDDLGARHRLAFHMVNEGRADVAVQLLERSMDSIESGPQEALLRRELAFAQLQNREFQGCLRTLAPLDQGSDEAADLADSELIYVRLLQAEAAIYADRREFSRRLLEQAEALVPNDEQRQTLDALYALHGRARHFPELTAAGLREWHFIQHASMLLKTAGGYFEDGSFAGRFEMLDLRVDMVAFLLKRLIDVLAWSGLEHECVVPTSDVAAPLAHALGQELGLPVLDGLPDRQGRAALLVAANAAELGPLSAGLVRNRRELTVFALNLDWTRDAPVCPEIVGVLAARSFLPWETRYTHDPDAGTTRALEPDTQAPELLGEQIVEALRALPDDPKAHDKFFMHYEPLRSELLLGNESGNPTRRRFTQLSPAWTPQSPAARAQQASEGQG
ncbi:MAG: hypothetical protein DHS20C15_24810 [Planctomycetota bacterium]|nr:MAG: hypothetical protein DHS20C15_24810 [Planctomycetota bacterium]